MPARTEHNATSGKADHFSGERATRDEVEPVLRGIMRDRTSQIDRMPPRDLLQHRAARRDGNAVGRSVRVVGIIALVFGVYLMHGLSGPNMSHDGLPGLGSASHSMDDMKPSGTAHQHSEGAAMLTMACAYAVLQLTTLAERRHQATSGPRPSVALRIPIGPLRGPEPPVPRFA